MEMKIFKSLSGNFIQDDLWNCCRGNQQYPYEGLRACNPYAGAVRLYLLEIATLLSLEFKRKEVKNGFA